MKIKMYTTLLTTVFLTAFSHAALLTWDAGGDGTSWFDGANWNPNQATVPENDYDADFRFGPSGTPTSVNRVSPGSGKIDDLFFESAGWTITGSSFSTLGTINSSGAGTNTVDTGISLFNNATWNIGAGNTLEHTGSNNSFYLRGNTISLSGTGTLKIDNQIGGYGGGTFGINIGTATMIAGSSGIFGFSVSSSASLNFTDAAGVLQVFGDETNANSLISAGRILNNTGSGSFQVTDAGGGFTQVVVIPEPSTASLLLLSGLTVLCVLRKRKS